MSALKWDVLLPGAAVASITTLSSAEGGASTTAGKHEALSCKIIFPDLYDGSSWNVVCGGNKSKSGICSSLEKLLLDKKGTNGVQK